MSVESGLFFDIIVVFAAAFLGGLTARILHSPVVLGYLVVGLLLGPHALQLVNDVETVRILAEFFCSPSALKFPSKAFASWGKWSF